MRNKSCPRLAKIAVAIILGSCFFRSVFAQDNLPKEARAEEFTELQKLARTYRAKGLESQRVGDVNTAIALLQKAVELDPNYAVAYNDLGVNYEGLGFGERALENYLKAAQVDPLYLSAYTNLALFYESRRDLSKAAACWQKRAELGLPDDPWTKKAVARLKDINLVLSERPVSDAREQSILGLMKDVSVRKEAVLKKDDKSVSREYFLEAKQSYKRGELAEALKQALDAQYLDQDNKEIEDFIEQVETRVLTR